MTFSDAIKIGLDNYANFSGRSSRSEYWWFYLACVLVNILLPLIGACIGGVIKDMPGAFVGALTGYVVSAILTFLPLLAVAVRRLHDTGHSGWWYFITLIPIVGPIWFIILMLTESDEANEYGLPTY